MYTHVLENYQIEIHQKPPINFCNQDICLKTYDPLGDYWRLTTFFPNPFRLGVHIL